MSNTFLNRVWEHSKAEGSELLVLLAIADHADDAGLAWPGITRLAKRARTSPRTVRRAVQALEALGELRLERGGGNRSSRYWVLTGVNLTGDSLSPVTPCHPTSVTGDTPPVTQLCHPTSDTAMSPEPLYNHQTTHKSARARGSRLSSLLPANFAISPAVRQWAAENGYDRLDGHLEAFKIKATAKGYTNANWDAALMLAIREDWAALRNGSSPTPPRPPSRCDETGCPDEGRYKHSDRMLCARHCTEANQRLGEQAHVH